MEDNQTENLIFESTCVLLRGYIKRKSKNGILRCFDKINLLDLEKIPDDIYSDYDKLVAKANFVLYE